MQEYEVMQGWNANSQPQTSTRQATSYVITSQKKVLANYKEIVWKNIIPYKLWFPTD